MSHYQALKFIELTDKYLQITRRPNCSVLEVGSYDVNGTVRNLLNSKTYIGIDLTDGPGVDEVMGGHECDFDSESFDLCIASEVFEHNPYWKETFANMYRMTKMHGVVLVTCGSTGRPEHGTARTDPSHAPGTQAIGWNYYHNISTREFRKILRDYQFGQHVVLYNNVSKDLYFVGIKGKPTLQDQFSVSSYVSSLAPVFEKDSSDDRSPFHARSIAISLIESPIFIAEKIFSDKTFQNFQIAYRKVVSSVWLRIKPHLNNK